MIKRWFERIYAGIRKIVTKIKTKRASKKHNTIFWSLTPKDDLDLQIYEQAIDYAFKKKDIHNVAISGAYGAGKSSIIASYKKKHRRLKFMHISLAHYQPISNQDGEANIAENALELKILNQLVHQIPARKIPQTGFRVKHPITFWRTLLWTISLAGFSMAMLYVFLFAKWGSFAITLTESLPEQFAPYIDATTQPYARLLALGICILFAVFILYKVISVQRLKNVLKKVSIQGNEIELSNGEVDSFFDRYLNEVRYLFENVGVDAIVFEDMDRFNMESIFERLHEVNTLVNLRRKKKPLRFIYLLRDDIYKTKDRTKFFDFIIPVIPVIDASNSYNKLKEMLEKASLIEGFDDSFLQGISLYIDDMRLLQNIVNEFIIYFDELKSTEPNANNMLAIITYKNLFPKDFSDLQLGRGYVASLFANKHLLIDARQKELNSQIKEAEARIQQIDAEIAKSEEEIDKIYVNPYSRYRSDEEKAAIALRKQLVREKKEGHSDELRASIIRDKKSLAELAQSNLSELLNRDNIDQFMVLSEHSQEYADVLQNEYFALLKYLIRNGFIGETHSDYMTYFYDGNISVTDKTFLRSITDQEAKEFTHPLRNVAVVLKRMRDIDFDQIESLNFDLFAFMLQHANANLPRYIAMMQTNKATDFVIEFFGKNRVMPELIRNLSKHWADFLHQAITNGWFDKKSMKEYSVNALLYLDSEELKAVNIDGCLTAYVSKMPDYLNIDNPDIDRLIASFEEIGIVFGTIDEEHADTTLLNAVYVSSLYTLNAANIAVMLHTQYSVRDDEAIMHRNYSEIMSRSHSPMAVYVLNNAEIYMQTYLGMCNGWVDDSEDSVIAILNSEDISLDTKIRYIAIMRTMITDLTAVTCIECWETMFEKERVVFSEHNALAAFFQNQELTPLLIGFVNKGQCVIDCDAIRNEYQNDKLVTFMEAMMREDSVSNTVFECWISGLYSICSDEYASFEVGTTLNAVKMRFLFDLNIIPMTADGLSFVRKHYCQHIRYFVVQRISEYVAIMNATIFIHEELLNLLTWQEVDSDTKLELLKHASQPIRISSSNYEAPVALHIVQHNFDESELPQCLLQYRKYSAEVREALVEKALLNIDVAIENADKLDDALVVSLMSSEIALEKRIEFLVKLMHVWSQECILQELDNCGLNEYRKLLKPYAGKTIAVDSISSKLLSAFQSAQWIDSYAKDANDTNLYRIELPKKKQK
ncbi:MAG: hypothetical protein IKW00_05080 [Clostridia bacterium]|nr:hypothetical protein [Clostridia bacterium]